ncbi:sugar phosphate isomerase/epimerase family protein [Virgibacillus byunsanensis]|uniref:Sugar phosphate isomerase/epimerase family protein n=1 Tax=Virgibacillus byunsanensis TaxID=570945 RepID=A0ABW3LSY6_9BACI
MKLAYMYATPDVNHSNVTAIQGDMFETLTYIQKIGYSGVELLVRDPREINQNRLKDIISELNLDVPAICTGEIYGEDKISFADNDSNIRKEAIVRMKATMEMARDFNAMVNIGRLRGRYINGIPKIQTLQWMKEAISECAHTYPEVPILLEPVNRQYANCLLNTKETLEFVEELNIPSLGMMLDVVHMLFEGEKLTETFQMAKNRFWHFHISDSDRYPPGYGDYDINIIMKLLIKSGFDKYVTIESFQKPNAMSAINRSYEVLEQHFN